MQDSAFRQRLQAGAGRAGVPLSPRVAQALETYYNLLNHWNKKINLTALPLDPPSEPSLDRLFIEPLMAAQYVEDRPLKWFDLGSGGGSPAIPLKIARPRALLSMVESRSRKAAFLREAARALGLKDVEVLAERIENIATPASAELVTVRAVRLDGPVRDAIARLLAPDGQLLFFGADVPPEADPRLALKSALQFPTTDGSKLFRFVRTSSR